MTIKLRPFKGGPEIEVDITVELPSGERIRERKKAPVSTRSGARRWAEARERELLQRGIRPTKRDVPTLAEFEPDYIESYVKANRQKHSSLTSKQSILRVHLVPKLGNKRLDQITTDDVQQLKASLADRSPKHVNNVLTTLGTLLKAAIKAKKIDSMPCEIELLDVSSADPEFFDFDELERLLDAAKAIDHRTYLFVLLGAQAGLRVGEIIALEWDDIDFRRGQLHVNRAEWMGVVDTPKHGKRRRVPLASRLTEALKQHRHLRGPRVLYRDDATTVTSKVLSGWLRAAAKRAGLKAKGATHKLRHTFCSHLAMRGAPVRSIQELAGHADLNMTLRYLNVSPRSVDHAIFLLNQPAPNFGELAETKGADSVSN